MPNPVFHTGCCNINSLLSYSELSRPLTHSLMTSGYTITGIARVTDEKMAESYVSATVLSDTLPLLTGDSYEGGIALKVIVWQDEG